MSSSEFNEISYQYLYFGTPFRLKKATCFSKFTIPFHRSVIRQPKLFQMKVSDKFLKQCETEAFLKFNNCFSTEFAR